MGRGKQIKMPLLEPIPDTPFTELAFHPIYFLEQFIIIFLSNYQLMAQFLPRHVMRMSLFVFFK